MARILDRISHRAGRGAKWTFVAMMGWGCLLSFGLGAAPRDLTGVWSMKIAGGDMFVLRLQCGVTCNGQFERPKGLSIAYTLFQVSDPRPRIDEVRSSKRVGEGWRLTLVAEDGEERDFVVSPQNSALLLSLADEPVDSGLGPWLLEPREQARLSQAWEPNRAYVVGDREDSDPEMATIYEEDQADRLKLGANQADWAKADRQRKTRTLGLLKAGRLTTGEDFERAAFVFQHGERPEDYLLAHALAMAATAKGRAGAVWLAAASFDRYLRSLGQRQIFGTQFSRGKAGEQIGAPCQGNVVPDVLRPQLGLPPSASRACSPVAGAESTHVQE